MLSLFIYFFSSHPQTRVLAAAVSVALCKARAGVEGESRVEEEGEEKDKGEAPASESTHLYERIQGKRSDEKERKQRKKKNEKGKKVVGRKQNKSL